MPLDILTRETEQVNPAILLAEEFMRRDPGNLLSAGEISRAGEVLEEGRMEIEAIRRQKAAFERSLASPSTGLPVGF